MVSQSAVLAIDGPASPADLLNLYESGVRTISDDTLQLGYDQIWQRDAKGMYIDIDSRDHDGSWHIPGMRPETCTSFSGLVMGEGPFQSRLQCQLQTSSSGGSRRNQLAGCVKRVNSLALGQSRIVS